VNSFSPPDAPTSATADRPVENSRSERHRRPGCKRCSTASTVQIRERKWNIRWASQEAESDHRKITLAPDQAIFFVGGSRVDAKPRAGYDMAVLLLTIDKTGVGNGTIALAARVKPNAEGSSFILDEPVELTKVAKLSNATK
jgi:hypothetical protein